MTNECSTTNGVKTKSIINDLETNDFVKIEPRPEDAQTHRGSVRITSIISD